MTARATIPAMRMAASSVYQITMDHSVLSSVSHSVISTAAPLMEGDCVRRATMVPGVMFSAWAETTVLDTTIVVRMEAQSAWRDTRGQTQTAPGSSVTQSAAPLVATALAVGCAGVMVAGEDGSAMSAYQKWDALLWEGIARSHGSASARKATLEPCAKQVACDCVMIFLE